jgi:hypothetical protein
MSRLPSLKGGDNFIHKYELSLQDIWRYQKSPRMGPHDYTVNQSLKGPRSSYLPHWTLHTTMQGLVTLLATTVLSASLVEAATYTVSDSFVGTSFFDALYGRQELRHIAMVGALQNRPTALTDPGILCDVWQGCSDYSHPLIISGVP